MQHIRITVVSSDINECESNPCMNGGICINKDNHYVCICKPKYTGTRCEGSKYIGSMGLSNCSL